VGWAPLVREQRLFDIRLPDALCYASLHGLDKVIQANPAARIGIISAGKSYQDVEQGLRQGGYCDGRLGSVPLAILKLGLVWPIDPDRIKSFCRNLDRLIVVEEKRPLLEDQLRNILYAQANQPEIIGKRFSNGERAFPSAQEITPEQVNAIVTRVALELDPGCGLSAPRRHHLPTTIEQVTTRLPSYCPGCPHGRSTQVIDGSRALGGIGCHSMAVLVDPIKTSFFSQMGGEGAMWIGQAPFTDEKHVFTNMGDGTYFHSGILAIRAAVAANIPITYKLLYNGFVSMTGGQAIDGEISVPQMIEQLNAEGVGRICLVSDEPAKYSKRHFPANTSVHPRQEYVFLEKQLREYPGVSVLLFDQACATERRRLRKRGQWAEAGCGDCSTISGCMAIEPLETPLGRKRQINQSSCNKDFSCLEGFCPALVTVSGATPRKHRHEASLDLGAISIPEPQLPEIQGSYAVLVAGIGGAGVVTVGQTLALAAHLDAHYSSNLDVTGLAQKYGAVHSHIKIAKSAEDLLATRVAAAEADALIGCDIVVAATDESLNRSNAQSGHAVVDTMLVPTSEFARNPDWQLDTAPMVARIDAVFQQRVEYFNAQKIAEVLLGDAIYANTMLMGACWQQGALPISKAALMRALELNGVAVKTNLEAFELGRLLVHERARIESVMPGESTVAGASEVETNDPDELVADRKSRLVDYQDEAYALRYAQAIERLRQRCGSIDRGDELVATAARYYYKLLAFKDGWEVARLHSSSQFTSALAEAFEGKIKLKFHIGSWPLAGRNPDSGEIIKRPTGDWLLKLFRFMVPLRFLRGSLLDPFRYTDEGKLARQLVEDYETDMQLVHDKLTQSNIDSAIRLLGLAEQIRGFGHVRERHVQALADERQSLVNALKEEA
jgi:indolepyruvate ferredoxin oxidoreductase